MKFGDILFPYNGDPSRDSKLIEELMHEAQVCDQLGMDALWLAEHHFSGICPYADPVGLAFAIAACTRRLRIGFSVLQACFHHPVKLAEQLSLLDNVSQGRLIVGLGRGNMAALYEYDAYNVKEDETQQRLLETEEILQALWTGTTAYRGTHWSVQIPRLRPSPFTKPHPLLLRAIVKDESFVEMARARRPFLAGFTSEADLVRKVELYRATMREGGASEEEIERNLSQCWTWRRVFVAETQQEAERIGLAAFRAMRQDRHEESARLYSAVGRAPRVAKGAEDALICGDPDRVAEAIAKMQTIGMGGAILQFRLGAMSAEVGEDNLRLFMTRVAPAFRTVERAPEKVGG